MITMQNAIEVECHRFVAEASELGWKPGEWPTHVPTDLSNGRPFYAYHDEIVDGELRSVSYQQGNGCITLRVFND